MKRTYLSVLAALSFATSAFACEAEPYLGDICITANAYCPVGYVEPAGQLLPIAQYQALYSLVRTTYGGDGKTTFALPDLRGRTPVGIGSAPFLSTVIPGQKRGQEGVTLTAATLPAHTHPFTVTRGDQNVTIPATMGIATTLTGTIGVVAAKADTGSNFTPVSGTTYRLAGTSTVGPYSNASLPAAPAQVNGVSVDASGMSPAIPAKTVAIPTVTGGAVGANVTSNTPMATVPPQLGMRYCIATSNALYPPQP